MKCHNCNCEVQSTYSICPYCGADLFSGREIKDVYPSKTELSAKREEPRDRPVYNGGKYYQENRVIPPSSGYDGMRRERFNYYDNRRNEKKEEGLLMPALMISLIALSFINIIISLMSFIK